MGTKTNYDIYMKRKTCRETEIRGRNSNLLLNHNGNNNKRHHDVESFPPVVNKGRKTVQSGIEEKEKNLFIR